MSLVSSSQMALELCAGKNQGWIWQRGCYLTTETSVPRQRGACPLGGDVEGDRESSPWAWGP